MTKEERNSRRRAVHAKYKRDRKKRWQRERNIAKTARGKGENNTHRPEFNYSPTIKNKESIWVKLLKWCNNLIKR
jgi:hypothetical protein